MKKSKIVTLALISAALASCHKVNRHQQDGKNVYMRSDTTASYSHANTNMNMLLWYYAFRPYGYYNSYNGHYSRSGFYSDGISEHSNVGTSSSKSSISRGGFGGEGGSVSS